MPTATIKPAGGGDYTTLQAWENAVGGMAADTYIADCYTGGNLGDIVFSGWTVTSTAIVKAADGEGHGGSATAGAYIDSTAAIAVDINTSPNNVVVRGLRILGRSANSTTHVIDITYANSSQILSVIIDGCLLKCRATAGQTGLRRAVQYNRTSAAQGAAGTRVQITNNILIMEVASTPAHEAINWNCYTVGGNIVGSALIANNTILRTGAGAAGRGIYLLWGFSGGTSADIDLDFYNNVVSDIAAACIVNSLFGSNSGNTNAGNNATSDTTSGAVGGSGNINSIIKADEFTDHAADWSLQETGQLYEAGFDLSGTFTNDAYALTRVVPWNIGAWGGTFITPAPDTETTSGVPTRCRTRVI